MNTPNAPLVAIHLSEADSFRHSVTQAADARPIASVWLAADAYVATTDPDLFDELVERLIAAAKDLRAARGERVHPLNTFTPSAA